LEDLACDLGQTCAGDVIGSIREVIRTQCFSVRREIYVNYVVKNTNWVPKIDPPHAIETIACPPHSISVFTESRIGQFVFRDVQMKAHKNS
jgi:hypothetical protein